MPLPFIAAAGLAGLGGAIGIGSDAIAANRQFNQQKELMQEQVKNQKELVDYNRSSQMTMWNDTNYESQMNHIKNAGLNPALLYGMSGGGGTTTGGGAPGASGGSVGQSNSAPQAMGMMLQAALLKAQKENIEADTAKKVMETDVIGGVNMQKTMQEASNIAQDTLNKEAQKQLIEVQTKIANIEADISKATRQDKIDQIKAEAIGAILTNGLTKSNIEVNSAQINKIAQDIAQGWSRIDIEKFRAEIEANFKGTDAIKGNFMEMLFDKIEDIMGVKTDRTPIKIGK